ncbi:MAG: acetyl-CoA carboxylase biotin carboxyl carrier protein [Lachnospiraceae bacterium]|nr:acetyl-CoA carboxylase biotin carboxyl carrier protein [Lachnospiraceae bacterium]
MKETDIRKYAQLMKELELTGLEITDKDQVVRLERNVAQAAPAVVTVPAAAQAAAAPAEAPAAVASDNGKGGVSVTSPIVGIFYAAPAENAEPYVSLGSTVKKGQTLCIVEAMKLMNEITADCDGVIEEICVTNGQMVEFGTVLFRIRG